MKIKEAHAGWGGGLGNEAENTLALDSASGSPWESSVKSPVREEVILLRDTRTKFPEAHWAGLKEWVMTREKEGNDKKSCWEIKYALHEHSSGG